VRHSTLHSGVIARPTQPSSDLRAQLQALANLGYDADRLRSAAGLTREDLENPEARFPFDVSAVVLRSAMTERPLSHIGLRLAASVPFGAYDVVDYLVYSCDRVRDGLERLARYFATVTQVVSLHVEDHGDEVRFLIRDAIGVRGTFRFAAEYTASITARRLREGTAGRCRVQHAAFEHRGADEAELERVLGFPVRFDQPFTGLVLSSEAAALPFERRDPVLRRVLEEHARDLDARLVPLEPTIAVIGRAVEAELAGGDPRIASVARRLGTTARTLQRRLGADGVTYQQLLDDARRRAAERYLRGSSLAIAEIAYLLGYSEASAFHRAFRRWTGLAPGDLRAARREPR
jgi:AraC-like DNA-binding protein